MTGGTILTEGTTLTGAGISTGTSIGIVDTKVSAGNVSA
jgi:hypothetical protein